MLMYVYSFVFLFFFKQKTAYEMRISDWSSDVCSSDLVGQAIRKVAPTGSRVLITGPAGAGKEVVARQLHACSHRAMAPFVALNCATMHPDRLEPELFGTEPGQVDGDGGGKVGTFEDRKSTRLNSSH